jgi:uncharacterized protein (DUF2344 family)
VSAIPINAPSAEKLIDRASYKLSIEHGGDLTQEQILHAIQAILQTRDIPYTQVSKSGKEQIINLRDRLYELSLSDYATPQFQICYTGSCTNEQNLKPDQVRWLLERFAQPDLTLLQIHRFALAPAMP